MKPLFAILIPFTPDRRQLLNRLMAELDKQRAGHDCVIITHETEHSKDGGPSTGAKRNECLDKAREINATNIAFFDSDDLPGPNYVKKNMECTIGGYDCMELWGQYYEHGKQLNPFHHSIIHDHWWQDAKYYYRNPNHLSNIRLDLLNGIRFKDISDGEDGHYSIAIHESGRLKNEYPCKEIIYYYFKNSPNHNLEPMMALKRGTAL